MRNSGLDIVELSLSQLSPDVIESIFTRAYRKVSFDSHGRCLVLSTDKYSTWGSKIISPITVSARPDLHHLSFGVSIAVSRHLFIASCIAEDINKCNFPFKAYVGEMSHGSKIETGESDFSHEHDDGDSNEAVWHLNLSYYHIVVEGRTLSERDVYEVFEMLEFALRSIFSKFKITELLAAEEAMKIELAKLDPTIAGVAALKRLEEMGIYTNLG